MCSRHAELGAGHPDWQPRPYLVLMADDDGGRIQVRVAAAIGPNDARSQAQYLRPSYVPLHTEREGPEHTTPDRSAA